jgi:hypothetical protein
LFGLYAIPTKVTVMAEIERDDPHDDITQWIGNLPKTNTDSTERTTERDTRRPQQPDVQRKEPPVEEGR